ncbi:TPA: type I-F CRISPR-associated endoribonuclease Cas6/Csy4 [Raoultella ornithinolytica]|uniref:type I-F CRISPR-associated endoribonuclease Cas6/Csy4 n=1 Tax=Raoultella ornithinolytica TaxID=54291 RepID=UPI0022A896AC|nr:type I-F CRISPR-associated endoribonuclease Cas6/Csy4 [Raoultella ornithinolytica]MCZ0882687.1 type I-F CRISPR-associated endoribonuclease Cas6/Csy4 [Raoultella ornithinolytica]MDV1100015.1 type I-F CRISPR-associated endoribonuclease Cas6/Csy4 [Raoultella ornithinolytica]HDH7802491.1 type I-F CRISPR-associated endoribonuclease Cas6/Csy4 [Raoultella ornithinolytica]HDH7838757.1 type I-F CRISPR-associated endoribonuclease Cas6/Csy4 [Raoultella ornithinolytica]HDT6555367.1 type I-F CRISPR-asso
MVRRRYFFVVNYIPAHVDCGLLAGRCISTLHGFLRHHTDVHIGVSFPEWSNKTLGRSIAFVSARRTDLELICGRSYFQIMEADNLFTISPVLNVPDECHDVRYVRNQNVAKIFPAERRRRLERAKRRAEGRGEIFQPRAPAELKQIDFFHTIFMQSSSNGQNYVLHIQKRECEYRTDDIFSRYGLSSNEIHTGSVPELNAVLPTLLLKG